MSLLPLYSDDYKIIDGTLFHVLPFCISHCNNKKCKAFYEELKSKPAGFYSCPYGLSTYTYNSSDQKLIFTGLKIRGYYNKDKAKVTINEKPVVYNPIINIEQCIALVQEMIDTMDEKQKAIAQLSAINDLLHETRTLNAQTKSSIDLLFDKYGDEENIPVDKLIETIKNAQVGSYLISNRFSYFDSILNPELQTGDPFPANVFRKFDKMRKLLKGYMQKDVRINLYSPIQSEFRYKIHPTFETLLFILLENAIKYSPEGEIVDISLNESNDNLDVTIKSIGPYCDENEILHLCDKGFRSENAILYRNKGQGFGLNFAKKICDMHDIGLSFESIYSHKSYGVKYGTFKILLHFNASL